MKEDRLHQQLCWRVLWSDAEQGLRLRIRPLWETTVTDVLKERLTKHVDVCKEPVKSRTLTLDPLLMIADEMNGIVDKQVLDRVCECALLGDETQLLAQALAELPRRRTLSVNLLKLLILSLRFNNCNITKMDRGLAELSRLQVLSLAGNWLSEIKGSWLPRSLKFLELFANQIEDVTYLSHKMPKFLVHLGLASNNITEASNLHLLGERCKNLRSLDLGDNDIFEPDIVTAALKDLKHLRSLRLEGNPCATLCDYRQKILGTLETIWYLDDMEVWPTDRTMMESDEKEKPEPSLLLYCYRIVGVPEPEPVKFKKQPVDITYQMEFEVPLLNPCLREDCARCVESRTKLLENPTQPSDVKVSKTKSKIGPQDFKDGTDLTSWVSTEPVHWASIMKFPEPVELKVPDNDLLVLRDTLKTKIRAKLVLMQTLKSQKRTQSKDLKKKKSDKVKESPKVMSKNIIAEFLIPLRPVKWCHPTDDFEWQVSESGKYPAEATAVGPTLQNITLPEEILSTKIKSSSKKDKKGEKKKHDKSEKEKEKVKPDKKGKRVSKERSVTVAEAEEKPPKPLTIHLGVGLRRLKPVPLSIPMSEALDVLDIRPEKLMALSCHTERQLISSS